MKGEKDKTALAPTGSNKVPLYERVKRRYSTLPRTGKGILLATIVSALLMKCAHYILQPPA
jgi:hypothetical protein